MNYTLEIWSDLTFDEKQIYKIYEAYQKEMRNRGDARKYLKQASAKSFPNIDRDGLYPADPIRQHKNWSYFERVWDMFDEDQNFDPDMFIEAVFRRLGKGKTLPPARLATKVNKQYYKDFRMKAKMSTKVDKDTIIMEDFVTTYKFIAKRMGKKQLTQQDLHTFFFETKDNILSEGLMFAIQEMLSPYYLAVSKTFQDAYMQTDKDIQDEIMDAETMLHIRALMKMKTRIYNFAKKVFPEDIL